jgi:hypothetical protein
MNPRDVLNAGQREKDREITTTKNKEQVNLINLLFLLFRHFHLIIYLPTVKDSNICGCGSMLRE